MSGIWNFWKGTGSYKIIELTEDDPVLSHLKKGTRFLECTTAGTIAFPSKKAYGRWEFDMYKGGDANSPSISFIDDAFSKYLDDPGYAIVFHSLERIYLIESSGGGSGLPKFNTASNYFNNQTNYRIRIDRTVDGEFTVYIKGGAFGDVWTLVDTTGGSGSNPVTDNTYTESQWFVLDLDQSDRISNIKIWEGVPV